ncbi:hypothetical protein L9F63_007113 [Diploptera punctata]|uniref:Uncharacterized protein n=1 Tax=Diploptera punctata TaxID=6984 RepID=A0AAD8E3L1_DIPPU|nr:hypothetical protein L9F63_007113 [Diploptera punctata]
MFQKKALVIRNMKVLSFILLGVFALGIVTFQSVTSLPKLKATPAPFNWQQFLPGGIASADKRAAVGGDTSSPSNGIYAAVPPKLAPNPMSPYLNLKPFLPVKPTIVPPFVDPNVFIGKKAELLGNLFGTGVGPAPAGVSSFLPPWISGGVIASPSFFTEKKATLLGTTLNNPDTDTSSSSSDSKRALSDEESTVSAEPRLVVGGPSMWGPPPGVIPTPKPTIVPAGYWSPFPAGSPAAGPIPPAVDPSVMLDKKTKFLNDLFNSLNTAPGTSGVSEGNAVPDSVPTEPTAAPPSYWLQFVPGYASSPPPTEKPTIVPPSFWIPSPVTKPVGLFGPPLPVVDPKQMIDKKTAFLNNLFNSLNISVTPVPVTTTAPSPDPMTAYQEKVADFLDKLLNAIINNGTDEVKAAKRALEDAENAKTSEDLKTFLGQTDTLEENAAKFESKLDTRSVVERSCADNSSDTECGMTQQLPVETLLTAKDKVVNTIITEMGGIKNNILDTLAELLAKQKEAAATPPPTPAPKKKPGPPFGPGGPFGIGGPFGPWAAGAAATTTTPKPTPNPEPFQKKVEFLGQVFDLLTQLEKDVTESLNQAVSEAAAMSAAAAAATTTAAPSTTTESQLNLSSVPTKQNGTTLIDLIRSKLIELANSTATPNQQVVQQIPKYARAVASFPGKPIGPPAPEPTIVDPSFWIPDPAAGVPVGPSYYMGKTQAFLSKLFESKAKTSTGVDDDTAGNKARSIKMAVHQGYQSLPPGSEELLQAGGGSTPEKHEGGGLKLQASTPTDTPSIFQGGSNHHRHHNHHN